MKSKDLIKKLQELDPTGETHVTGTAGAILFLDTLPGYYDGPGSYIEDDKFFIDQKNNKIVLYENDVEDFIWDHDGDYSGIVLLGIDKKEYEERFKKISDKCKQIHKRLLEEHLCTVLRKVQKGYRVFQHKDDKGKYSGVFYVEKGHQFERTHHLEIYKDRNKHQEILCQGDVDVLKESGFFEEVEEDDYITWKLNLK